MFQRSRKCSIVQEDEEEEDISSCSGREELTASHCSLNRRGSRSEGRLNLALQERLADSERRKPLNDSVDVPKPEVNLKIAQVKKMAEDRPKSAEEKVRLVQSGQKWRMGKSCSIPETNSPDILKNVRQNTDIINTTVITDSSTISIPVVTNSALSCQVWNFFNCVFILLF